jgi:hypothetical protein
LEHHCSGGSPTALEYRGDIGLEDATVTVAIAVVPTASPGLVPA